jgi:hypothetical protein
MDKNEIRNEILLQTGQFDSETVYYLVYKSKNLNSLSFLNIFVNVVYLDVSFNELTSTKGISALKNLQTLILDGNKIDDFSMFKYLYKYLLVDLVECQSISLLSLCGIPYISSLESVSFIKSLQNLRHVYFQHQKNSIKSPICNIPKYRMLLASLCPHLCTIDMCHVAFDFLPAPEEIFVDNRNNNFKLQVIPWVSNNQNTSLLNLQTTFLDDTVMQAKETLKQINEFIKNNKLS